MMHWNGQVSTGAGKVIAKDDRAAAIDEFIRTKGITRCPTACVLPTQGRVGAADRVALGEHAVARDRMRRERLAARVRSLWAAGTPLAGEG
jgi:hypothetical protein